MKAQMWFDGACRGNPGGKSAGAAVLKLVVYAEDNPDTIPFDIGLVAYGKDGMTFVRVESKPIVVLGSVFRGTNNEAEFQGLLVGLHEALKRGVTDLTIRGDSKLVVELVAGRWKCRKPHLQVLLYDATLLLGNIPKWDIAWIPREENAEADQASNDAIDKPRKVVA